MDVYDSRHTVTIMLWYYREKGAKNFEGRKRSSVTIKIFAAGTSGLGDTSGSGTAGLAVSGKALQREGMEIYYYGSLRQEKRELIMPKLESPQGGYATEELVRQLTESIGKKANNKVIEAPAVMDRDQIELIMKNSIGNDFVWRCLIYEPQDIAAQPESSDEDLMMTEVLVTGENIVANAKGDTTRTTARSNAQTRSMIPGEVAPKMSDADARVKKNQ
jgi:hypothetical protein